ncbi:MULTISPECIES: 16S rRNA (cytosine(967)-C(5))-methyltransferase RsmB [Gammaproteobacteria]|uniref:16S rRNA (cytosine(967)-C(5))-methyltransferase RsmB n=1 Tax=Gammaproteobacteria TaxID=1236 RepID=UPI000DCFE5FD|nr:MULTISPECIES: 16S rRNA (cytosine(967)-C(5))-methyltransferase RsmB [Gammaproteobacteria]RTE86670.1 16S rRNA (cytosine(967)-C(5))-methyltransferase RsmB [Aliidiomarina sp. B3213]TCZ90777.1 16S rRNA (cytosine(967)-C(5))-methyltransferase RsmB [Lysobacter sp. N42]
MTTASSKNTNKKGAARAAAAKALFAVLEQKRSLTAVLPEVQASLEGADKGWVQTVCFQVLRELPRYEWLIQQLVDKPLKKKVRIIHSLLLVGLCQFRSLQTPPHAILAETVEAARILKQKPLTGLVNGVLRSYQRQQEALETQVLQRYSLAQCFPRWLRERVTEAWPEHAEQVFAASQEKPPLWLRVNVKHIEPSAYLELLQKEGIGAIQHPTLSSAIRLEKPIDVKQLPHFDEGFLSVQDISAQWAARLLEPKPGQRVLDACAAPGGKTAHIAELAETIELDAVELEASRIERMEQNFERLNVNANVLCQDASAPETWWNGKPYDRILLDAPCSATGVIRRHPDIKWLRQNADIAALVQLQSDILEACWSMLAPGGRLVYATCSLLPEENDKQIQNFIAKHDNANYVIDTTFSSVHVRGGQILPGEDAGDGFFYAILEKAKKN